MKGVTHSIHCLLSLCVIFSGACKESSKSTKSYTKGPASTTSAPDPNVAANQTTNTKPVTSGNTGIGTTTAQTAGGIQDLIAAFTKGPGSNDLSSLFKSLSSLFPFLSELGGADKAKQPNASGLDGIIAMITDLLEGGTKDTDKSKDSSLTLTETTSSSMAEPEVNKVYLAAWDYRLVTMTNSKGATIHVYVPAAADRSHKYPVVLGTQFDLLQKNDPESFKKLIKYWPILIDFNGSDKLLLLRALEYVRNQFNTSTISYLQSF
jgi:hypothetical protein